MSTTEWEIRVCENPECGLRYPVEKGQPQGLRCPICLGAARIVLSYSANNEREQPPETSDHVPVSGLLDNIRSLWNVGAVFRTAEGFGASHLYLTGITSTPDSAGLGKTALGAEKNVAWSYHRNSVKLAKQLAEEGYVLWALETSSLARSASLIKQSLDSTLRSKGLILVLGNEKSGVDPGLLELCHETFFIPMVGQKSSFNVSVAFGIALGLIRFTAGEEK